MISKITILVDEQMDASRYVVCSNLRGEHSFISSGVITNPEELRNIQLQFKADAVQIDCAFMGTELQRASESYNWKLVKFKNTDFPFIEAMVQLARIRSRQRLF